MYNTTDQFLQAHTANTPTGEFISGTKQAWKDAAPSLTKWVNAHLVNRNDVHGYYFGKGEPVNGRRPCDSYTRHEPLTDRMLWEHFGGDGERIGVHCYDAHGVGTWVCVDIDAHDDAVAENWTDALHVAGVLHSWGVTPLIEHSNGGFGFKLWALFNEDLPVAVLRSVGMYLVKGLAVQPEVFPKSSDVKKCGNFVRLPGRHHKRINWWSGFYDVAAGVWHDGPDAPAFMLAHTPNDVALVPLEAREYVPPTPEPGDYQRCEDGNNGDWSRYKGNLTTLNVVKLVTDAGLYRGRSGIGVQIVCPWADQHTNGKDDAFVIDNGSGKWPGFKCFHGHCAGRTLADFLGTFPADKVDACCSGRFQGAETQYDPDEVTSRCYSFDHEPSNSERVRDYDPDHLDDDRPRKKSPEPDPDRYQFRPLNSSAFARTEYTVEWLIRRALVKDQPCILGGPKKALKTSTLVDLTLSLGSGTKFLNYFDVPRKFRTLLISGESGGHTIQETARRVCRAKNITLDDTDCLWDFRLPQLSVDDDLAELGRGIREAGVEVVIIDPLYLCLLSGGDGGKNAGNLYDMGPLLSKVSRACLDAGATPILAHHARKGGGKQFQTYDPIELDDLSFSGVQEFARQWLLLSRREAFVPGSGLHHLWLSAGGSCGHGGLWGLNVNEGRLQDDFTGRTWEVHVTTLDDIQVARTEAKAEKKKSEDDEAGDELLNTLDDAEMSRNKLRTKLGWGVGKYDRVLAHLEGKGRLKVSEKTITTKTKNVVTTEVVRRV